MTKHLFSFLGVGCLLVFAACTNDELPEPVETPCDDAVLTYETDIRPIIEQTCAYSGCHLGGAPGLYNDYDGLLPDLESGLFAQRVIQRAADPVFGMPPNYAPADRPRDLDSTQLQLITCWLESGFAR